MSVDTLLLNSAFDEVGDVVEIWKKKRKTKKIDIIKIILPNVPDDALLLAEKNPQEMTRLLNRCAISIHPKAQVKPINQTYSLKEAKALLAAFREQEKRL